MTQEEADAIHIANGKWAYESLIREFNNIRSTKMEGKVTRTRYTDDMSAVLVEVHMDFRDCNGVDTDGDITLSMSQDKARRFPVGTVVELGIKVKRV